MDLAEIRTQVTRRYVQSYMPLAVVSEICNHTPAHVKLTSLSYIREPGKEKSSPEAKQLIIKGRVTAHPYSLDAALGKYIITLSESPVFGDIDIQDKEKSEKSGSEGKATMIFEAVLEVL